MADIPTQQANLDVINSFLRQNPNFSKLQAGNSLMISESPARKEPYVTIDEQPKQRGLRFRYKCEGRSAGSIPGEHSTSDRKTYPSIKIHNFEGPAAIVVVSCVTKDKPFHPHPHNLVGQDCRDGVCTVKVKNPSSVITFPNIGIQCCKRHDVEDNLKIREKIRVDPYSTGYPGANNNIDLNSVRLCFQVFLPDANKKFTHIVPPIVSQPIIDKKSVHDLVICRLSRQSGYAVGGDEVFLLCEKINKDDIQVRFYEETDDGEVWEGNGDFAPNDVHRQYAIVFKTPPYRNPDIQEPVTVFVQLRRPSDDEVGDPKPFQYIPQDLDPYGLNMKRKKKELNISDPSPNQIPKMVMDESSPDDQDLNDAFNNISAYKHQSQQPGRMNIRNKLKKKAEEGLQRRDKAQNLDIKFDPGATTFNTDLPKYSLIASPLQPTIIPTINNNINSNIVNNSNNISNNNISIDNTGLHGLTATQLIHLLQKNTIGGSSNVVFLKNVGGSQLQNSHIPAQFLVPSCTGNFPNSTILTNCTNLIANNDITTTSTATTTTNNIISSSSSSVNSGQQIIVASSHEAADMLATGDHYISLDHMSGDSIPNLSGFSDLMAGVDSTVSNRDLDVGAQEMVVEEGGMLQSKQEHIDGSSDH